MTNKSRKYWFSARFYYSQLLEDGNSWELALKKAIRWANEDCFDTQ